MTWIPHWTVAGWLGARITHWLKRRFLNRRGGKRLASPEQLDALRRRFAK